MIATDAATLMSPARKNLLLLTLMLILFTHFMDFMILMPLGPGLMRRFNITTTQFSWLVSIYSISAGILGFIGTFLFDRIHRRAAVVWTYVGFLIGTAVCGLAENFWILLLARAIAGAFGGLLGGLSFALIGDVFEPHERGQATGKLMVAFSLSAIFGVPTGLWLSTTYNWHTPFFSICTLGLGLVFMAQVLVPPILPQEKKSMATESSPKVHHWWDALTSNMSDPNARTAISATFFMMLSSFVVVPFISPFLVANTGYPEDKLPLIYLLGGLVTVIGGPLVGRLSDQYSPRFTFTITGLLYLIPALIITRLGTNPLVWTLVITSSYFLTSNLRMVPMMTMVTSSVPGHRRGGFLSLNSCIQQIGSGFASFLGGWVVTSQGPSSPFVGFENTAYLSIVFGLGAYYFGRRIKTVA